MTFCDLRSRLRCRRNDYGWWWRWDMSGGITGASCVSSGAAVVCLCAVFSYTTIRDTTTKKRVTDYPAPSFLLT